MLNDFCTRRQYWRSQRLRLFPKLYSYTALFKEHWIFYIFLKPPISPKPHFILTQHSHKLIPVHTPSLYYTDPTLTPLHMGALATHVPYSTFQYIFVRYLLIHTMCMHTHTLPHYPFARTDSTLTLLFSHHNTYSPACT